MFAFVSPPYVMTAWIGGPLATRFLASPGGYRWGFGTFAIIQPIVCTPLLLLFWWNYRKAKKQGLMQRVKTNRTTYQSIMHYLIEFDAVGVFLLSGGLALFLLPFNIYSYQALGWRSPMIICMIVFGLVLLAGFGLYEKSLSPKCFLPFHLLVDRTVVGACCLAAILFVSYFIWNAFFTSFLQVVQGLSITHAGYIESIYSVGACLWSLVIGFAIRYFGRFEWAALYFGVPLNILVVGLLIDFHQPEYSIGFIVMCQIFLAFAGGACVIAEQMAVMAAVSHEYIAAVLAVEGMSSSIGDAIGQTIASAIWTGVFRQKLDRFLPADVDDNALIYESLDKQLSYPVGSAIRTAIVKAYGEAQKLMTIAATAVI